MKTRHLVGTWRDHGGRSRTHAGGPRTASAGLAHLCSMEIEQQRPEALESVLSISELAERLHVSVQTIYDLRSQGRGPRGFRIGRELRFRRSEIDAWLSRLEAVDGARHPESRT